MPTELKHGDVEGLRIAASLRHEGQRSRWPLRVAAVIVAVAVLGTAARLAFGFFSPKAVEVETLVVHTETVAGATDTILSARGYVVPHHRISVNSKVTGRVAWIGVEKGDLVREGQVLVRLEDQELRAQLTQARGELEDAQARSLQDQHGSRPEEVEQANDNLIEARASAENDKAEFNRTRDLYDQQIVSKQAFENAASKFQASEARMNSLAQQVSLLRLGPRSEELQRAQGDLLQAEGQVQYASAQLDATLIRAPISGTILERTAEKGELVTAEFASGAEGGPRGSVVVLADLSDLQVELDIAQDDFARLTPGQHAIVTLDAFKDRAYRGQLTEISPEANRQKASVQVKVKVLDPDIYLRPEMNASVQFTSLQSGPPQTQENLSSVFVPASTIHDKNGDKVVYLVLDGKAARRSVHLVSQRRDGWLVDALAAGDSVITAAPVDLKDRQRVHVKGQP